MFIWPPGFLTFDFMDRVFLVKTVNNMQTTEYNNNSYCSLSLNDL